MGCLQDLITVQEADFDVAEQYQILASSAKSGAVVFFVGLVRDYNQGEMVSGLTLEHYPAMTQKALQQIVAQAKSRWPLDAVRLVHRVGHLQLNEQIVFVGVSSRHREASFAACQFIMDYLKNQAPFWKKEVTQSGERWVEAQSKDKSALQRWL